MNHDEWLERADIYALGALEGEELARFEDHLASGCAQCEAYLRETREALTALPRSLAPVEPPAATKARLLSQIGAGREVPVLDRSRVRWLWWGMGAGAVAAASLVLVLSWDLIATRQELRRLQSQIAALQTSLTQREELIQFLSNPQIRIVTLAGLPASPEARAQLLWNPSARTGLLLATGLPQTPIDKAYELWGIAGAEPVPAGVFVVNERGQALFRLPPLPETKIFDKFAVTLEPAGGVPKPTGTMFLLGSL
jgi:anti-sigma-K factor RskA